jgi:hypothetical protein
MRHKDGTRFDHCIGLQDKGEDGRIFDANTLDCHDKSLSPGEDILVGNRPYRYRGDDNLGNSIFIPLEPFPECETVECECNGFSTVLEIYRMKNGHFYVWPYVQSGSTDSGSYSRQAFAFKGEFETREAAIEAGLAAGKERINTLYSGC